MKLRIIIVIALSYIAYNYLEKDEVNFGSFGATQGDTERLTNLVKKADSVLASSEKKYIIKEDISPDSKCDCGGSGYIVHGDGHKTKCTCPDPCKCEKPKSKEETIGELWNNLTPEEKMNYSQSVPEIAKTITELSTLKAKVEKLQPVFDSLEKGLLYIHNVNTNQFEQVQK